MSGLGRSVLCFVMPNFGGVTKRAASVAHCYVLACHDILADTWNYRRQINVKYLVSSKSVSKCSGSASRALRYLTASPILLGGLKGWTGHLLKECLVFLQKSMCSGVLSRPHEQFSLAVLWYCFASARFGSVDLETSL